MSFVLWVVRNGGADVEKVSGPVSAEQAEAMLNHPSLHGLQVVVLPEWSSFVPN